MAYVFGVENVPVFELLFIMFGLQMVALAVMYVEIKKLVNLIAKERLDISRFEDDLASFERVEGKKPPQKLVNVVKEAKSRGIPDRHIEKTLDNSGWKDDEISLIMQKARKIP